MLHVWYICQVLYTIYTLFVTPKQVGLWKFQHHGAAVPGITSLQRPLQVMFVSHPHWNVITPSKSPWCRMVIPYDHVMTCFLNALDSSPKHPLEILGRLVTSTVPHSYGHITVISTEQTPFIECIIPFIECIIPFIECITPFIECIIP